MPRVAFFLDTRSVRDVDVRDVESGNPGIGGTEYMFFLVASRLARARDVTMYVTAAGAFPAGVTYRVAQDLRDAAAQMSVHREDLLVVRESEVVPNEVLLQGLKQKVVVWAHNFSHHRTLRACARCPSVARYLCVSREQYENLRDEAVFRKAEYVFNAIVTDRWPSDPEPSTEDAVFYMGSLVEAKGFHVLARHWSEVVAAVPTARLHVVGSGHLYDRSAPLGPLGLASAEYERRFAPFVTDRGRLRPDVVFHGTLGVEKVAQLRRAKVAVANPTGVGETFCLSAAEFGLLGVPVVSRRFGGVVNVVESGVTGILFDDERELPGAIVRLLRDEALRTAMGRNASTRVRSQFDIRPVMERWERIVRDVHAGVAPTPDLRMTGTRKRLRELNRKLKRVPLLRGLPSGNYWSYQLEKKRKSWFVDPLRRLRER